MSTVILLSSSPPRVFARSPIPADSSSPGLPALGSILKSDPETHRKFKTSAVHRDGLSGGFRCARPLLATRIGAENLPVNTQAKKKASVERADLEHEGGYSKSNQKSESKKGLRTEESEFSSTDAARLRPPEPQKRSKENCYQKVAGKEQLCELASQLKDPSTSPLLLEKASLRRLDWTPPKPMVVVSVSVHSPTRPASPSKPFRGGLFGSFGYDTSTSTIPCTGSHEEGAPTKRRRLDLIVTGSRKPANSKTSVNRLEPQEYTEATKPRKSRTKSPVKKPITITGLATARYSLDIEQDRPSPMVQYLSASQTKTTTGDSQHPPPEPGKPKRASKKEKAKRKATTRLKLLSPESAMKGLDTQEMMFGSASQLAREESPTLMRDTLEALKRSESTLMSDQGSIQMTQPISIESTTPRTSRGTARFAKSKDLWSAAGRDEDNALLQVDSVDLFDTPGIRLAFAGKDVLLEPRSRDMRSPEKMSSSLRAGRLPALGHAATPCYDIDDITTPVPRLSKPSSSLVQCRSFHVGAIVRTSKISVPDQALREAMLATTSDQGQAPGKKQTTVSDVNTASLPKSTKPSYIGFSTHDLQKQISAYGFKPIKKREKMIELLENCWEDQHRAKENTISGIEAVQKEATDPPTHGDFLGKVHDISSRAVPKTKKPKGRPKKSIGETTGNVADANSPKKRKRAEPRSKKINDSRTKTPQKRKPKTSALSEDFIVHIDDIEDSGIKVIDKVKYPSPTKATSNLKFYPPKRALVTPPPTIASISTSLLTDSSLPPVASASAPTSCSSTLTTLPEIHSQIGLAITSFTPEPGRDHRADPTWHEKILLYDPIVLEDLAAWLNTEGLQRIREDREVSALEVRDWCEREGVCCLWRGGWRGNGNGSGKAGREENDEIED